MFKRKPEHKGQADSVDYANDPAALRVLIIDYEAKRHLDRVKGKPARVLPRRDSSYLIELANGAFSNKQGQIFYNPSDRQLDKIFEGELYGYR